MKHEVKIVAIGDVRKHPNADTLGIVSISGYEVIVRTADWSAGDKGVYIEPDYIVPDAPWSAMLKGKNRVRVKRLRGVVSAGLLLRLSDVGLDPETPVGTDVMGSLGIMRYVPPEDTPGAADAPAPRIADGLRAYDLESWRAPGNRALIAGDTIVSATEKLHGESARFVYSEGAMHAGSRTKWKRLDSNTGWAVALKANPWIEAWCRAHPDCILYGEILGHVPEMHYGVRKGLRGFLAFDVWCDGRWLDVAEFQSIVDAKYRVPVLYEGPHSGVTAELAEGVSTIAPHVREGFVVKPFFEASDPSIGRIALKCVGNGYHERGGS